MADPSQLKKYLAGTATDEEIRLCEAYLQDPSNRKDLESESLEASPNDSLLETLRDVGNQTHVFDSQELVAQIQSLVPGQDIGEEELDRILSPAESAEEIGRIGRYRVIEFLAGGGMGYVFKAEDPELDRLVCIKVLDPMLARSEDAKTRFAREAKAASKLCNSRITTVLGFGTHKELPFLVMELLEGQSLRAKLNDEGTLGPQLAEKFTLQIAQGLRYAHQRGILHRDVKPENIWVTPEGDIKLLDFGLARSIEATADLTQSGTILGTPNYMSPEQVQGKELDQRSDLFSVGSVLFEMLTGESPFGKSNMFSTMMSVANDSLAYPEPISGKAIPQPLTDVIDSLLQKDPEQRVASADQLIAQLDGTAAPRKAAGSRSNIGTWLAGAIAGAACLALALFLYQLNDKGTLLVEADPSVNVNIANEKVSIEDPQTGRKFNVTIGENPLPSGVYTLNMTDASGDYTLSSNVITIRRGEEQIVRVELKPNETDSSDVEAANSHVADSAAKKTQPPSSKRLGDLPTLSALELRRKLGVASHTPLFPNATVKEPSPKEGVTSWSIEPVFDFATKPRLNSDGSLIAMRNRTGDRTTTIRDRTGKLLHIIPAQDKVVDIAWSPLPNILAVNVNGQTKKQVTIWKLFDDHFEALDVIPCDCNRTGWSFDGLKLALQSTATDEITFVDLSKKGGVFAQPNLGIEGGISSRPWSQDGRYFATKVNAGVKVWDLDEQKVVHIFVQKRDAKFLANENWISVKDGKNWEVWDLDSFERKQLVEPESDWRQTWPDPTFEKAVGVTAEGQFAVKDSASGKCVKCDITWPNPKNIGVSTVHWSADGARYLVYNTIIGMVVSRDSEKNMIEDFAKTSPIGNFGRRYVATGHGLNGGEIVHYSAGRMAWFNDIHADDKPRPISVFDTESNKSFPDSQCKMFEDGVFYRISPNGKFIAIVGSDTPIKGGLVSEEWSKKVSRIRVCSIATGEVVKTIETGSRNFYVLWTPDSSSLIVSAYIRKDVEKEQATEAPQTSFEKQIKKLYDRHDRNKDGKLSGAEVPQRSMLKLDIDKDGTLTMAEFAASIPVEARTIQYPGDASDKQFLELETKIVSLNDGTEVVLSPGALPSSEPNAETEVELCFQRSSKMKPWGIASPVLYNGQIVIPLFEKSDYRKGSRPTYKQGSDGKLAKLNASDRLGFFDIKTGELRDVIELNETFRGDRLDVTDQMIMIGQSSDIRNSKIDSFLVFDRKKGNRVHATNPQWQVISKSMDMLRKQNRTASRRTDNILKPGAPTLSPSHPYLALKAREGIEIWKLDSDADSFDLVRSISFEKGSRLGPRQITWHSKSPVVAWLSNYKLVFYDVEKNVLEKTDDGVTYTSITPVEDGWLLTGHGRMEKRDLEMKIQKTWLTTNQFTDEKRTGSYDQCVTAEGDVLVADNKSNLRVVQLRDNRFETKTIEEFERQK